jgi:hypothetical protein
MQPAEEPGEAPEKSKKPKPISTTEMLAGIISRSNFEHVAEMDETDKSHAHIKGLVVIASQTLVILASFLLVYRLASLFLVHGNPEHAEKIVIGVLGILGGIGIGEVGHGFSRRK